MGRRLIKPDCLWQAVGTHGGLFLKLGRARGTHESLVYDSLPFQICINMFEISNNRKVST